LHQLVRGSEFPLARLHALYALKGLGALCSDVPSKCAGPGRQRGGGGEVLGSHFAIS